MLSSNNILSPAHGSPIAVPTQDMVLGCYYLTKPRPGARGEGRTFASTDDVLIALEMGEVETLTPIKLRYTGRVIDLVHAFDNQNILHTEPIEFNKQYMETTVGRVILNDNLPRDMPFINGLLKKKGLGQLVQYCYLKFGLQVTVGMLDEVKNLGFLYATRAGISIGIDDMVVPGEKAGLVREAEKEVVAVESQYQDGAITHGERYNKIIEIWSKVTEKVSDEMFQPWKRTTARAATSTRSTSWPTRARAVPSSRSASSRACAASWPSPPARSSRPPSPPTSARG